LLTKIKIANNEENKIINH